MASLFLCLLMVAVTYLTQAANILGIFIAPAYSHQMPLLRISKVLAARGHNLTVITTNPSEVPVSNHTEIDVSFVYDVIKKYRANHTLQSRIPLSTVVLTAMDNVAEVTELQMKSPQVQNFLRWGKDVKFDLVLYESVGSTPYLAYVYTIGSPPVIAISTVESAFIYDETMGCPTHTAYQPTMSFYTDHMTFLERFMNTFYWFYVTGYRNWFIYPRYDHLIRELFHDGLPSSYELDHNKTLLIYTRNSILGYPKPLTPNIVQVGPLHIVPPKALPEELRKWVDGAEDGVIYFSLGSSIQGTALTKETQDSFLRVFKQFPKYRVVWKWESDIKIPGEADNVLFQKWIPQQDLLANEKVTIFISQCGLQSAQEAIHYGVNLICTPLYRDQIQVSKRTVHHGIGIELDIFDLSYQVIYKTIKEIITNPRYRVNIQEVSALANDNVLPPLEQAIWWIEYTLRHKGARHLRPATLDISWIQYWFIDAALFLICIISISLFILFKLAKVIMMMSKKLKFHAKCE